MVHLAILRVVFTSTTLSPSPLLTRIPQNLRFAVTVTLVTRPISTAGIGASHELCNTCCLPGSHRTAARGYPDQPPPSSNGCQAIYRAYFQPLAGRVAQPRAYEVLNSEKSETFVARRQLMLWTLGMGKLTEAIQAAVRASPQSAYKIAKGPGVARSQLSRLLSSEW